MLACISVWAQDAQYFPYPTPPETLPVGRPRANYMVEHFWDRCPWKSAYSAPGRMESALIDFSDFLPLAAPDTVRLAVDKLIKSSQKKPADFASLMRLAEKTFNSDSAALFSDEVYLPFAEAASVYKKFNAQERENYARQARRIRSSSEGTTLPALKATDRNGLEFLLNDTISGAPSYVIIIEEPGDRSARFERVRFAANVAARTLVDGGVLKPILIHAGQADEEWWKSTENLPANWSVGQMPDAAEYFDLRMRPAIYMLDPQMTVVSKWIPMGSLINNCEQLLRMLQQQ